MERARCIIAQPHHNRLRDRANRARARTVGQGVHSPVLARKWRLSTYHASIEHRTTNASGKSDHTMVQPADNNAIPAGAPGSNASPTGIRHDDHVDYLQQGHLRHMRQDGTMEEHTVPVSDVNPDRCSPVDAAKQQHDDAHRHGPVCGHEAVPHAGHMDYLVNGRLHHPHGDHCDDHGPVDVVH